LGQPSRENGVPGLGTNGKGFDALLTGVPRFTDGTGSAKEGGKGCEEVLLAIVDAVHVAHDTTNFNLVKKIQQKFLRIFAASYNPVHYYNRLLSGGQKLA